MTASVSGTATASSSQRENYYLPSALGVVEGDIIVAVTMAGNVPAFSVPGDWTVDVDQLVGVNRVNIAHKIAGPSEVNQTISTTTNSPLTGFVIRITGSAGLLDMAWQLDASDTEATAPPVTPGEDALIVSLWAGKTNTADPFTWTGPYTPAVFTQNGPNVPAMRAGGYEWGSLGSTIPQPATAGSSSAGARVGLTIAAETDLVDGCVQAAWTRHTPMPVSVIADGVDAGAGGSCTIDGLIYIVGGFNTGSEQLLQIYDPATDTWTTGASLPEQKYTAGVCAYDGKVWVFGGSPDDESAYVYDPGTDAWTAIAGMPTPGRHSGPAVDAIGDLIYLAGGIHSGSTGEDEAWVYDPALDTYTAIAPMPSGLGFCKGRTLNGRLHVPGGREGSGIMRGYHYAYDPATDTWATLAAAAATDRYGLAVANGKLWKAGGGQGGAGFTQAVRSYDPDTNTWNNSEPALGSVNYGNHGNMEAINQTLWYVKGGDDYSVLMCMRTTPASKFHTGMSKRTL